MLESARSRGYTNLIGKTSKSLTYEIRRLLRSLLEPSNLLQLLMRQRRLEEFLANDTYPYEFLMDNMLIQNNLIRSAHENDVQSSSS